MNLLYRPVLFLLTLLTFASLANAQDFSLSPTGQPLMVLYSKAGPQLDSVCAHLLASDIEQVTGQKPAVISNVKEAKGRVIVIGDAQSELVQGIIGKQSALLGKLKNKWECFALKVVDSPVAGISKAFVIAGSDDRGTAYGVFSLSEKIGVSPWNWWADVPVKKQANLVVQQPEYVSASPSVKFRGIFINDEDWGLRPWASNTYEPAVKNIGPKTYAKVFELLLRLKANFIWPAMHPGTKAFYTVPGNKEVAALYHIVIGSSHAEPMLRNNVGEWNEKTMGPFNYITNKDKVDAYWEERVKASSGNDVVYTMGMRGVHDGQMEGVKTAKQAVPLLEQIFQYQRDLLKKYQQKDITAIPQVFTPYKEVLEFYDNGLKVPDDITLVWPDDNYGYIQRLSDEQEQKRRGGAGVYYHVSYWGRPHDYLWLCTTHPSLIREEMMKAYQTGADKLWVLNVGDIKPAEYDIQLFLDMAYNVTPFKSSAYTQQHLQNWSNSIFGSYGKTISNTLWQYYDLAFERKPEFMGWSQTEPNTPVKHTAYNHFYYGDEARHRVDAYNALEKTVDELRAKIDANKADAFYQLVYYPVVGAAEMNKKFLYNDKAWLYAKQNRISAYSYAAMAKQAYRRIDQETAFYNQDMAKGRWKGMMTIKPRALSVFDMPATPAITISKKQTWGIAPEGVDTTATTDFKLPAFTAGLKQAHFIDLFLSDSTTVDWHAEPSAAWINISSQSGKLSADQLNSQTRLWVSINWDKAPQSAQFDGVITFTGAGRSYKVKVNAMHAPGNFKGFMESDGYVSLFASHYTDLVNKIGAQWQLVNGLGHTGDAMMTPVSARPEKVLDQSALKDKASCLSYDFYTYSEASPKVILYALPTLPLNRSTGVRCAFSIDGGPLQTVDFKANSVSRTEEWKQNVLSNQAVRKVDYQPLKAGKHTLKVYAIDQGVVLDRMLIDLGGLKPAYSVIAETK